MAKRQISEQDAIVILAMADQNLNRTGTARQVYLTTTAVVYHLDKVKRLTGLDPRNFYDLVELLKVAHNVLDSEGDG